MSAPERSPKSDKSDHNQQRPQTSNPEMPSSEQEFLPALKPGQNGLDPTTLSTRDVLYLQRTLGNQFVQRMIAKPQQHVSAVTAITPASKVSIQREDLEALYGEHVKSKDEKYRKYLDDFNKVNALLQDEARVELYLTNISEAIDEWAPNLNTTLKAYEKAYAAAVPVLIGSAGGAFTRIVNRGQMFEDLVAKPHGVYSHRIQWYLVGEDIKANGGYHFTAVQLFREASREFWRNTAEITKGKFMWERLVDTFGGTATTFTTPDRLEEYIIANAKKKFTRLQAEVAKSSTGQRARKAELRQRYTDSDHATQNEGKEVPRDAEVIIDGDIYTGFLKSGWSEASDSWLPTVVYPSGNNPEARPPEL